MPELPEATIERRETDRGRSSQAWPSPPQAPRWMTWAPQTTVLWALAYGLLRVHWVTHGSPPFGKLAFDLIIFTGWRAVCLCAATAIVALALRVMRWSPPLLIFAWLLSVAHFVASPLLLLDVVYGLLPGLGLPFDLAGFISRAGCFVEGILIGEVAIAYRRRWRSECMFCGRAGDRAPLAKTPRWAWWAAYAAVAGCLVRLGAQVAIGFGVMHALARTTRLAFEVGIFETAFLLAGMLLPLALVYSWGRVFPRWVPLLAGRRAPRWLLLGPAFTFSALMTVYFGLTMVKVITVTIQGTANTEFAPLPLAFFWVAVPAYWVWGIGLGIAAISYYKITRPACRVCGRR